MSDTVVTSSKSIDLGARAMLLACMKGHVVRLPLRKAANIVGRAVDCDVKLDFVEVSRKHCRIELKAQAATINDLGSSGGTFINGERVSAPTPLNDGDKLGFGELDFYFVRMTPIADDAWPMLVPESGGAPIQLRSELITVGRGKADFVVPEARVSTQHAALATPSAQCVYVIDLGSTNGTTLNGVAVTAPVAMKHGDVVAFAGAPYRLVLGDGGGRTVVGAVMPKGIFAQAKASGAKDSFSTTELEQALADRRAARDAEETGATEAYSTDDVAAADADDTQGDEDSALAAVPPSEPIAMRLSTRTVTALRKLRTGDKPTWKRFGVVLVVFGLAVFPFQLTISAECRFVPGQSRKVRAKVAGTVTQVHVKDAETVVAGQKLVTLSDRALVFERTRASLMLEQAKAGLDTLVKGATPEAKKIGEERLRGAQTSLSFAKKSLVRSEAMAKDGIISREALQRTQESYAAALQAVREAESEVQLVSAKPTPERVATQQAEVETADKALKLAEQRLADLELTAEVAGKIGTANTAALVGRIVTSGQEVLEINDYAKMQLEILVPESEINDVKNDLAVDARVRSNPLHVYHSRVTEVGLVAEKSATGSLFIVKGYVDNPDGALIGGSTGNAKILGSRYPGIYLVARRILRMLRIDLL